MAGSLLDGDDFSSIGVSKAAKKGRGPTDNAMKAKIAVIVVCLGGAGAQGSCVHGRCEEGAPLAPLCDRPPAPTSCVDAICAAQPGCCSGVWDASCVAAVGTVCGLGCE